MNAPDSSQRMIAVGRLHGAFGVRGEVKLESFTVGQETVLVRNEDYAWASPLAKNRGPAKIAKLTLREIAEDSTAFLELKSGGVDMLLGVPTDFLGEVKAQPNLGVVTLPGQDVAYMPINVTKEPFTDIRVREAAAKAINAQQAKILRKIGVTDVVYPELEVGRRVAHAHRWAPGRGAGRKR